MIDIDLTEEYGFPYGPELRGSTQYGSQFFAFQPTKLLISGQFNPDISEVPKVTICGPRIMARTGLKSDVTTGYARGSWKELLPKHRLEYLDRVVAKRLKNAQDAEQRLTEAMHARNFERQAQGLEVLDASQ